MPSKSLTSSLASKDCVGSQSLTAMFSSTTASTCVRRYSLPSTTAIGCYCCCARPLCSTMQLLHPSSIKSRGENENPRYLRALDSN
ncbi:hypothetical protein AAC387_Pa02g1218 [Persea americana]